MCEALTNWHQGSDTQLVWKLVKLTSKHVILKNTILKYSLEKKTYFYICYIIVK